jgi:hypothetical protein
MVELATEYGRYGYRRVTAMLRQEGLAIYAARRITTDDVLGVLAEKNGYIESFNGKLREQLLNPEIFDTLPEA